MCKFNWLLCSGLHIHFAGLAEIRWNDIYCAPDSQQQQNPDGKKVYVWNELSLLGKCNYCL
jgi:hypothetical protein